MASTDRAERRRTKRVLAAVLAIVLLAILALAAYELISAPRARLGQTEPAQTVREPGSPHRVTGHSS
jgi:peptidoglycan/LPS O-acetylase OafA/YrhL